MINKIFFYLLLLGFLPALSYSQQAVGYDSLIRKLALDFETPGIAVAVMKNYEFKEIVYGYSNLAEKIPITNNTAFNVASISKLVTAHAVMQLAEEGKVDLDKPIETYLTKWKFSPSQYDPKQVTIRRVLNHSAGLSTEFGPGFTEKDTLLSLPEILSGNSLKRRSLRIVNKPGEEHVYSNLGYGLLQLLIEEVSGKTFQEYIQENLFDKLSIINSSFKDPLQLDKSFGLATPYDYRMNPLGQERFVVVAAAGLQTNLADLEKLMLEETKDKKLLNISSLDQLHDTSLKSRYGLGHMISKKINNKTIIGHTGLGMGWNASFQFIASQGDGIIVLTNGDNGSYIHNTLTCNWYYSLTGEYISSCNVAPDKKLNRITMFLEMATEQGELTMQDFQKFNGLLEESRKKLNNNQFKKFIDQLQQLQSEINNTIRNTAIQKNVNEAFDACYYWINQPWFTN